MTQKGKLLDRPIADVPSFVKDHPEVETYWTRVLQPALGSISDDGALSVFLNLQIEEWDIQGDGPWPAPFNSTKPAREVADLIIDLLQDTLAFHFLRVCSRIKAAEAQLSRAA